MPAEAVILTGAPITAPGPRPERSAPRVVRGPRQAAGRVSFSRRRRIRRLAAAVHGRPEVIEARAARERVPAHRHQLAVDRHEILELVDERSTGVAFGVRLRQAEEPLFPEEVRGDAPEARLAVGVRDARAARRRVRGLRLHALPPLTVTEPPRTAAVVLPR